MAIMDAQNRPSNAQAVTVTAVSTDSIDLLTANRNPGRGGDMRMQAHVVTDFAGGTSIKAQLIESASGSLTSPTVLAEGPVVNTADAVAGAELLDVKVPDTAKRYIGLNYVVVGTHTAGAVTAGIVAGTARPSTEIEMNQGL